MPQSTEDSEPKKITATEPLTHIIALADDKEGIGARPAGSKQERQAAQYIFQQLRRIGLEAEQQTFAIEANEKQATSMNISAVIPGESNKRIVIGAHFDSTGVEQGSLGASGDLAPLSHLALVLLGKGEAFYKGEQISGAEAMERAGITPVKLVAKEGLALNNGTQVMTAVGALAYTRALRLCRVADIAHAASLDAYLGTTDAFDPLVHQVRPHAGQLASSQNILALISGSKLLFF